MEIRKRTKMLNKKRESMKRKRKRNGDQKENEDAE
jgi:hypothetical protein